MANIRPSVDNTCALIVTYNPDGDFPVRASKIATQLRKIIIVDNCSSHNSANTIREVSSHLECALLSNSKNLGIATALNQGMSWARQYNYSWVVTLDQDTTVRDSMLEIFQRTYDEVAKKFRVAIVGSNYLDINTGRYLLRSQSLRSSWVEMKSVITAGSLISLEAFQKVGPFRDDFFIDLVDVEYCLRARAKGFRLFVPLEPTIEHEIGRATRYKIAGMSIGTTNHVPERRYYMARNHAVLAKEYLLIDPIWVISTLYTRLKSIFLIFFLEDRKIIKLKLTLLGFIDGLLNNFHRNLNRNAK